MASAIARDLAERGPFSSITLADLNADRVRDRAAALPRGKGAPLELDVRNRAELSKALGEHEVVVNSTWYRLNTEVMSAAIKEGTPYVDLGGLYHVSLEQLKLDGAARDRGVMCLIGMGSTPGTMNVMATHAAAQLDSTEEAILASASKVVKEGRGFQVPYSLATMLDEASMPAVIFEDGHLKEVEPLDCAIPVDLPAPLGKVEAYATLHSELATLPGNLDKGLRRMLFVLHLPEAMVAYLRTLTDLGLTSREPVETSAGKVVPYDFLVRHLGGMKPETMELDVDLQMAELHGWKDGERATARVWCTSWPREDRGIPGGTWGTGVPPSIAAAMLAKGDITTTGVVPPELAIDPLPYFDELRKRGIEVQWDLKI